MGFRFGTFRREVAVSLRLWGGNMVGACEVPFPGLLPCRPKDISVCSVVKIHPSSLTPPPAGQHGARGGTGTRREVLRLACARLHPPSVHFRRVAFLRDRTPPPAWLGAQCTRAALGAWRPNGLGPQYHASLGGTRLSRGVRTDSAHSTMRRREGRACRVRLHGSPSSHLCRSVSGESVSVEIYG